MNGLYEKLEAKRWGRVWTTQELALGFVGDVGDLAKPVQAHAGVRTIDDCQADKCGIDLEAAFVRNTREISEYVSGELAR